MEYRLNCARCLLVCLGVSFIIGCYLASIPIQIEKEALLSHKNAKVMGIVQKKKLAVLVPFRDRFDELLEFVPHMHKFLNKQNIPFHIFVLQQKDNNRFNRASLINAGFLYTKNNYDYIAMHDVDLLPLNDNLKYDYPGDGPVHISSPETHPKYHYATFIGGILLIRNDHFESVRGMSNRYWGWGLEDDEFYVRLKDAGLIVRRPENISTGTDNTFKHMHDKSYRQRDMRRCYNQKEVTRYRDRQTGLHDIKYNMASTHEVTIDKLPLTVLNIELVCDAQLTPWCQCPEPEKNSKKKN